MHLTNKPTADNERKRAALKLARAQAQGTSIHCDVGEVLAYETDIGNNQAAAQPPQGDN